MKFFCAFFAGVISLAAQAVLPPLAGTYLDAHGRIAVLHGVLGNLLPPEYEVPPQELTGVPILSAAFGSNGSALKTKSQLVVLDSSGQVIGSRPAPPGTAIFGFSPEGVPAWVYYPSDSELVNLSTGVSITADRVVALGVSAGSSVPQLRGITGPAAFFQNGWLTGSSTGLVWTPLSGGQAALQIALPEPVTSIQISGPQSVVINGQWLLNAHFQLLEIPLPPRRPPLKAHP
jgi:hypothetical protein